MTVIEMLVPLAGGRSCTVTFDPSFGPVDFAPLHELNGARMAQPTAPLSLKSLKENGAGAPLLHSAPTSSQEWRNPSPSGEFLGSKKTSLKDDLIGTREAISDKASDMAELDLVLAPVREEERSIRDAILATHKRDGDVVILNLGRAKERGPLFSQLDDISREWGPVKERRRRLNSEIKNLERVADRLQKLIENESRKKRKA